MSVPRLDVDFMAARRLELDYSQRDMASQLGVSLGVVTALEDARNHARVTLDLLYRVADVLQVPAARLLATEQDEPSESGQEDSPASAFRDAVRVGVLLWKAGKAVPPAALARVLRLDLTSVIAAVAALQAHASAPGALFRVTTSNSRVGLLPRDDQLTDTEVRAVDREIMAVDELRHGGARILSAVIHGDIQSDRDQMMRRGERPLLQSLLRQGLIERHDKGRLKLSGEVAFSLGLTDARRAGLRRNKDEGAGN